MTYNIFDWTGTPFLELYAVLMIAALLGSLAFEALLKRRSSFVVASSLAPIELALLAGGASRAADVLALQLVQDGHFVVRADGNLEPSPSANSNLPMVRALATKDGIIKRKILEERLGRWIVSPWDDLARLRLVLS